MTADDFSKMPYQPFGLKKRMWVEYPRLALVRDGMLSAVPVEYFNRRKEEPIPDEEEMDLLLKYVALMAVRHGNPLAKEKDWNIRVKTAVSLVGIRPGGNLYKRIVHRHWWVTGVLAEFFKFINDADYALWVAQRSSIFDQTEWLSQPITDSDDIEKAVALKAKLSGLISTQITELRKLEGRLFPSDELLALMAESESIDDDLAGWAEKYALTWPT